MQYDNLLADEEPRRSVRYGEGILAIVIGMILGAALGYYIGFLTFAG